LTIISIPWCVFLI